MNIGKIFLQTIRRSWKKFFSFKKSTSYSHYNSFSNITKVPYIRQQQPRPSSVQNVPVSPQQKQNIKKLPIKINLFEIADEYRRNNWKLKRKNPEVITNQVLNAYARELKTEGSFIHGIIPQLDEYALLRSPKKQSYVKLFDYFMRDIKCVTDILECENPGKIIKRKLAVNIVMNSLKKPLPKTLPLSVNKLRQYEKARWPDASTKKPLQNIAERMNEDLTNFEQFLQQKKSNEDPIDWDQLLERRIKQLQKKNKNEFHGKVVPAFSTDHHRTKN